MSDVQPEVKTEKKRRLYLDPLAEMAAAAAEKPQAQAPAAPAMPATPATTPAATVACSCGMSLSAENASKLPDGTWVHIGCMSASRRTIAIPAELWEEDEREGVAVSAVAPAPAAPVAPPAQLAASPVAPAPVTLPVAAPAVPVAAPVAVALPPTAAPKVKKPRAPKQPTVGWFASNGLGRWGPFPDQLAAFEASVLGPAFATEVAVEVAAGRPPTFRGMPVVNVGAPGVPKWVPAGLVMYPERL